MVAGPTAAGLDEVVDSIERASGEPGRSDQHREPAQVDALRDTVYERFGRVDFLVNNAGGQFPGLPSTIQGNGCAPLSISTSTAPGT